MTDLELLWAIDKYLPDKYLPLFHEMEKQAAAAPDMAARIERFVDVCTRYIEWHENIYAEYGTKIYNDIIADMRAVGKAEVTE